MVNCIKGNSKETFFQFYFVKKVLKDLLSYDASRN